VGPLRWRSRCVLRKHRINTHTHSASRCVATADAARPLNVSLLMVSSELGRLVNDRYASNASAQDYLTHLRDLRVSA
jgi:hypothetical protein